MANPANPVNALTLVESWWRPAGGPFRQGHDPW